MDGSGNTALLVVSLVLLGTVNWVATEIIVNSYIFKDLRELVERLGTRMETRLPHVGDKVRYFVSCPLCVGVWIGLIEALVFDGPLQPHPHWLSWSAFIANGLAYKGLGHLMLQVNALFHHRVALTDKQQEVAAQELLIKENEVRILGCSDNPVPEQQRT